MTLNVEHARDNNVQPITAAVTDFSTIFINRDLSLLEFFRRVLEEALDKEQLPLERLKFVPTTARDGERPYISDYAAFLIGEHLLKAASPAAALRALVAPA